MGYNLFQRRGKGDAEESEFAATELSLPPGPDPLAAAAESRPSAVDSAIDSAIDSAVPDIVTEHGADSQPAPLVEAAVERRPTLSHVGRYALKGLLGQGGLGQVHEAWDPLLSRTVAVKTLQFDSDTPTRVALDGLFLNEARAAAGLSHPHIVTVHDAGLSARGVYIAMERLHGCDLRQRLAAGWQPTPGQAAQLVRRVADALAYAHARGVVHCDIKPANIFLNKRDKPKVLDFGIARVAHSTALQSGAGSLDGAVLGSPHYLAPEQLAGGVVDARTDIHALGVVFYELLTLRKAFTGDSLEQITTAVLTNHPAPAHELRPGVSRTLSAITDKAMARAPDARYASAAEMAGELRRWVDRHMAEEPERQPAAAEHASPVAAPSVPTTPQRIGRRPSARTVTVAAALALGGGASLVLALREPAAQPAQAPPAAAAAAANPASVAVPVVTPSEATTGASADETPPAIEAAKTVADPAPVAAHPVVRAAPPRARPAPPRETRLPAVAAPAEVARGALQFAISPWGQVEIDGTPAGITPPLARLTLPEGPHTVTVRNEDFQPYTTTVTVSADKPVTVRHRFGQ